MQEGHGEGTEETTDSLEVDGAELPPPGEALRHSLMSTSEGSSDVPHTHRRLSSASSSEKEDGASEDADSKRIQVAEESLFKTLDSLKRALQHDREGEGRELEDTKRKLAIAETELRVLRKEFSSFCELIEERLVKGYGIEVGYDSPASIAAVRAENAALRDTVAELSMQLRKAKEGSE